MVKIEYVLCDESFEQVTPRISAEVATDGVVAWIVAMQKKFQNLTIVSMEIRGRKIVLEELDGQSKTG